MQNSFIEDNLWIFVIGILVFTCFIAYTLNKNTDPSEEEEDEDNINLDGTHNED